MSAALAPATTPPHAVLTEYERTDLAMTCEIVAKGEDPTDSDRARLLRAARLIEALPTVAGCRRCHRNAASTGWDDMCRGCATVDGDHAWREI